MAEATDPSAAFPRGLLRPELYMGILSSVSAQSVRINLADGGSPSGSHFLGGRYGKGEVGEFVLVEGQTNLLLGRVIEVHLPEADRRSLSSAQARVPNLDAVGTIQLLGSVAMDDLRVTAGVESYPRLGDRVYAAPHKFVADLPRLMEPSDAPESTVLLELGSIDVAIESKVTVRPEKLFGRHCAILGATGGGKSWTTAHLIEECLKYDAKIILLDATSEYRRLDGPFVEHHHLSTPVHTAPSSQACSIPPSSFIESDFIALFDPSGKVQGPKLKAAIRSLRLAHLAPHLATNGLIKKIGVQKAPILAAQANPAYADKLEDPKQPFDVSKLTDQIREECVWDDTRNPGYWSESQEFTYCLALVTRISTIITSSALDCVFKSAAPSVTKQISAFFKGNKRLMRICLGGVAHEFLAREIVTNAIGRKLLGGARAGLFAQKPVVVIVDEAHNFLGRHIGNEDTIAKLDAFEVIAKEGRKYGLSICLATQRPRDITDGVLSQMGTLVVHRLTNDRDREVVERACGEIDKSASSFLPNLKPGEAAIIGADFPIPLTIQVTPPIATPFSDGPNYQKHWQLKDEGAVASEGTTTSDNNQA